LRLRGAGADRGLFHGRRFHTLIVILVVAAIGGGAARRRPRGVRPDVPEGRSRRCWHPRFWRGRLRPSSRLRRVLLLRSALRTRYSRYMAYTCLSALTSSPVGFLPCAFAKSVSQVLIFTLQFSTFALISRSPPRDPEPAPRDPAPAPDVDGTSATTPPLRSMAFLCAPKNEKDALSARRL
jgi:hypothetical protein